MFTPHRTGSCLPGWLIAVIILGTSTPWIQAQEEPTGRIGVIGIHSGHGVAFTKIINDPAGQGLVAQFEVVMGYPNRHPGAEIKAGYVRDFDKQVQQAGVKLVDSLSTLIEAVDFVMVMDNEGQPHLRHALPAMQAGKPIYVDKPVAPSLKEVIAIYKLAERHGVPIFSSSSLRYTSTAQAIAQGSLGRVLGADTYSPAPLEPTHTDLFWYGIHGVEPLFTVMGPGCRTVRRTHTEHFDLVVGIWEDGRIGSVRGTRQGRHAYGGTAFGAGGIAPVGEFEGYGPLVVKILEFFKTGRPPIEPHETLEIYGFMEAADESKRRGGAPVLLQEVLEKAQAEADAILGDLLFKGPTR